MPPRHAPAAPEHREQHGAETEHDPVVQGGGPGVDRHREAGGRHPQHRQDVEDVGSQEVAEGDLVFAVDRRCGGRGELGQTRAHGHHGEPDDALRHAQELGDGRGPVDQEMTA